MDIFSHESVFSSRAWTEKREKGRICIDLHRGAGIIRMGGRRMGRRSAANVLLFVTHLRLATACDVIIYRYSRFRITANFWNALHRVTREAADSAGGAVLPQPFPCPRKARGRLQRCCRKPQRSVSLSGGQGRLQGQSSRQKIKKTYRKVSCTSAPAGCLPFRLSYYLCWIRPCSFKSSAHSTAPPAAPRSVLWERPTNFQSKSVSSLRRPMETPIPFS